MARKRPSESPPPDDPELTVSREEAARRLDERIAKGRQIADRDFRSIDDINTARDEFSKWGTYNNELLTRLFTTPKFAKEYSWFGIGMMRTHPPSHAERIADLKKDAAEKINRLESIKERLELIPMPAGIASASSAGTRLHTNRAFIVHGHDDAAREAVARFLEHLGIEAIILHEQPTGGRTLVEKLETYSDVDFAVVLLTPDDVGAAVGDSARLQPRARQNVLLELGYFVGKLSRSNVCALYRGPMELPTDYVGVGYVMLDDSGGWKLHLAKELRAAGFSVDMNLAF